MIQDGIECRAWGGIGWRGGRGVYGFKSDRIPSNSCGGIDGSRSHITCSFRSRIFGPALRRYSSKIDVRLQPWGCDGD